MINDSTLQRIWNARQEIYAQCGNDPLKLVTHYIERQKRNPQRLLKAISETEKLHKESGSEQSPNDSVEIEASV